MVRKCGLLLQRCAWRQRVAQTITLSPPPTLVAATSFWTLCEKDKSRVSEVVCRQTPAASGSSSSGGVENTASSLASATVSAASPFVGAKLTPLGMCTMVEAGALTTPSAHEPSALPSRSDIVCCGGGTGNSVRRGGGTYVYLSVQGRIPQVLLCAVWGRHREGGRRAAWVRARALPLLLSGAAVCAAVLELVAEAGDEVLGLRLRRVKVVVVVELGGCVAVGVGVRPLLKRMRQEPTARRLRSRRIRRRADVVALCVLLRRTTAPAVEHTGEDAKTHNCCGGVWVTSASSNY